MNVIDTYARDVVEGRIPAGKYHRLACARHLRDRAREGTADFPWVFDSARALRFFRFAEKLKHYKGEWAGQRIVLQPHQKFRLGSIFAWVHPETGLRRFRHSYHELPRKNGKSLEASTVMLYLSFFDGEPGAEGYTIATKRDQAKLVHTDCKQLVLSSGLKNRIKVRVSNLHRADTASKLEPLGADHDSTDGLNPNAVCADELHAYKTRGLIDVMETATGARRQPHFFKITTAGDDPVSVGGDEHDYACKILDGVLVDESYFAFIAHADPEDDWLDESTWAKANPNWGVSVKPDDMRALATKAQGMPSAAATFKQKRLNLWVNASLPWLSMEGWRKGQSGWTLADMEHESCWIGVDLAAKLDLCVAMLMFPPAPGRPQWRGLPLIWTPGDTVRERSRRDRAPYDIWAQQGHLMLTDGPVSHAVIRGELVKMRAHVDIERIVFDPWHAEQIAGDLVRLDGFAKDRIVEIPQTYAGMSKAALEYEAAVSEGLMDVAGHPVVSHAARSVVVQRDGKDNIYPVKSKSRGRIDPIVASILAIAAWLRTRPTVSVYATREAHVF